MENEFTKALKRLSAAMRKAMHPEGYVCIGCGAELKKEYHSKSICPSCSAELRYRTGNRCVKCGDYIHSGTLCQNCSAISPLFEKADALFDYTALARRLIINYKDNEKPFLAKYIADYMIEYALAMEITADLMTYVPSTPKTLVQRGFDHCAKLAKLFSAGTNIPLVEPLVRIKHTRDQTKLNYAQRYQAVQGAFVISPNFDKEELTDKTVLLIDDILTTGATASECAKTLKEAGAKAVYVLTFAR